MGRSSLIVCTARVWSWPNSAVVGIRPERQLSRDELPYTAIEHDGRIRPQTDRSERSPGKPNREPLRARVITKPGRQQQSSWRCISGGGSCGWIVYNDATTRAAAFRCREIEPRSIRDADERQSAQFRPLGDQRSPIAGSVHGFSETPDGGPCRKIFRFPNCSMTLIRARCGML